MLTRFELLLPFQLWVLLRKLNLLQATLNQLWKSVKRHRVYFIDGCAHTFRLEVDNLICRLLLLRTSGDGRAPLLDCLRVVSRCPNLRSALVRRLEGVLDRWIIHVDIWLRRQHDSALWNLRILTGPWVLHIVSLAKDAVRAEANALHGVAFSGHIQLI